MINLEREYLEAERIYDLATFDSDPGIAYELTVCYSDFIKKNMREDLVCVRQTMSEIKEEIRKLGNQISLEMEGLIVIAYGIDDSCPTPAYLVVRKELRN